MRYIYIYSEFIRIIHHIIFVCGLVVLPVLWVYYYGSFYDSSLLCGYLSYIVCNCILYYVYSLCIRGYDDDVHIYFCRSSIISRGGYRISHIFRYSILLDRYEGYYSSRQIWLPLSLRSVYRLVCGSGILYCLSFGVIYNILYIILYGVIIYNGVI